MPSAARLFVVVQDSETMRESDDVRAGGYTPRRQLGLPFAVETALGVPTNAAGWVFGPVKVPAGNLWVMGDNRNDSLDSRAHQDDEFSGSVPVKDVRGKAVCKIWPLNRIGPVRSPDPQRN